VLGGRLQKQRSQFALSVVDFDKLTDSSLDLLTTIGGLGKNITEATSNLGNMTEGLNEIQTMAPLAGMSIEQSMALMGSAIRSFGLKGKGETSAFFKEFDISRRTAELGAQDFMESLGDIESLEVRWGKATRGMVAHMGRMVSGMGEVSAEQKALIHGFTGLTRLPIAKTLAIEMAGGLSLAQASARISGSMKPGAGGPAVEMVRAFRTMMEKQMPTATGVEKGLFMDRFLGEAGFTPLAERAAFDPAFMEKLLTGKPEEVAAAVKDAMDVESVLKYAQSQAGTLEIIQKTLTNLVQFIIRVPILGMGGANLYTDRLRAMDISHESAVKNSAAAIGR
jgi:hypothetical protein